MAAAAALVACLAAGAVLLSLRSRQKADPTRFGPERVLSITSADLASHRLQVSGSTNLPDGARLGVIIATTEPCQHYSTRAVRGRFFIDLTDDRTTTSGAYRVLVSFRIEEQDEALREAMRYQPLRLDAAAPLSVDSTDPAKDLRPKLRALIQAANAAKDRDALVKVAGDAQAFERELWISTLLPGARRLRRALDVALRGSGRLDLERLRRELIEADVLASL